MPDKLLRRTALKLLGASAASVGSIGAESAGNGKKRGSIRKMGQTILELSQGGVGGR